MTEPGSSQPTARRNFVRARWGGREVAREASDLGFWARIAHGLAPGFVGAGKILGHEGATSEKSGHPPTSLSANRGCPGFGPQIVGN